MRLALPVFCLLAFLSSAFAADRSLTSVTKEQKKLDDQNIRLFTDLPPSISSYTFEVATGREVLSAPAICAGGHVADPFVLRRVKSHLRPGESEPAAYLLQFQFQMPEIGIASYTVQMDLLEDGRVKTEIDLPAFSADPRKLHFIPLFKAIEIAKKNGFNSPDLEAGIGYDERRDDLHWYFLKSAAYVEHPEATWVIEIDAHSGKVHKSEIVF